MLATGELNQVEAGGKGEVEEVKGAAAATERQRTGLEELGGPGWNPRDSPEQGNPRMGFHVCVGYYSTVPDQISAFPRTGSALPGQGWARGVCQLLWGPAGGGTCVLSMEPVGGRGGAVAEEELWPTDRDSPSGASGS